MANTASEKLGLLANGNVVRKSLVSMEGKLSIVFNDDLIIVIKSDNKTKEDKNAPNS